MKKYYNPKRSKGLTLKEGDRVYLFYGNIKGTRNIKTKRPYNKLDFGKLGAYLIEKEVYLDVYQLKLPEKSRLYPIVYISLLKPIPDDTQLATNNVKMEGESKKFEVERILDSERIDG